MTDNEIDVDDIGNSYQFRDVPLKPSILAALAPQIVAAETFRRSDLAGAGEEYHLANGGRKAERAHPLQQAKKAINILYSRGLIEPAAPQYWRWAEPREHIPVTVVEVTESSVDEDLEFEVSDDILTEGAGGGNLYVYYFPAYRELAQLRNESRWPVKIGMTANRSAAARISSQVGTAMPEFPVIAYVRRTDTPAKLERLVHSVLHYRGQTIEDAPGDEWFLTSPTEVKAIVDWVFSL